MWKFSHQVVLSTVFMPGASNQSGIPSRALAGVSWD